MCCWHTLYRQPAAGLPAQAEKEYSILFRRNKKHAVAVCTRSQWQVPRHVFFRRAGRAGPWHVFFRQAGWAGPWHVFFRRAGRAGPWHVFFSAGTGCGEASWAAAFFFAAHHFHEWAVQSTQSCWQLGCSMICLGRPAGLGHGMFFFRRAGWAGPWHVFFAGPAGLGHGMFFFAGPAGLGRGMFFFRRAGRAGPWHVFLEIWLYANILVLQHRTSPSPRTVNGPEHQTKYKKQQTITSTQITIRQQNKQTTTSNNNKQ